ncbi:MAG: hypothetical protein ACOC8B_00145 [Gemmatimonadota bacterium]
MGARRIMLATMALAAAVPGAAQDPPRVGAGAYAGTIFGAELMDQRFVIDVPAGPRTLIQEVSLRRVVLAGLEGEWFVHPNLAVRAHAAWGGGRLDAETRAEDGGEFDPEPFTNGFGDVTLRALDAGLSLWPWAPRTVGLAPFMTLGYGRFSYEFQADPGEEPFFLADGVRTGNAIVVGFGADMRIWESITLRMEAANHIVDTPLRGDDFATFGEVRWRESDGLDEHVDNVRLVAGVFVYLPFDDGDGL